MRRSGGVRCADRAVVIALLAALLPSTPAASVEEGEPAGPRNRLAGESSPYLLLHADDPVAWYPWGAEAFERARAEGRPVFLSIGYSACYWCHVMEREVFSDPEIAALMNRWFVNVKVDREERPDVDEIYITASQLLTGNAGWPASLFLTPELEPFFAGSYFPPEDGDGKAGFPTVLRRVHDAWTGERRAELEAAAERLTAAVRDALSERDAPAAAVPPAGAAEAVLEALARGYDETWGGFARPPAYRPKFPRPGDLFLLLEAWDRGDEAAGRRLVETLRAMGRGAIHDQLEGGFHRYTLDRAWRVPHFEKMLHDNALLGELLAEVSARGSDPELRHLARATLDFLLEQMALPGGGFVSSFDAETAAGEGAYYTWTKEEVREVLGEEGAALLAPVYGLDDDGELEGGRHTLYRSTAPEEALRARLAPHLAKLLAARQRRPAPQVDDKVLTDWNGMAVAALARGAAVFDEPRYLEAARAAAASLLDRVGPGDGEDDAGTLRHAWRAGEAKIPAFLDDYAFLVDGLLTLAEAEDHLGAAADPGSETGPGAAGRPSRRWIDAAETLAAELEARLRAPGGGYYLAAPEPHLPFQTRSITGGALPAGNAVAILALLELAERTGEPAYRERAAAALRAFAPALERYPSAVPGLARALLRFHAPESAAAEPGGAPVR